jgi:hypothetical protein
MCTHTCHYVLECVIVTGLKMAYYEPKHHHHISVMELGHLLTLSGLMSGNM